jgi:hypothetical protein
MMALTDLLDMWNYTMPREHEPPLRHLPSI